MKTHVVKLEDLEEFLEKNSFEVVPKSKALWRWPPRICVRRVASAQVSVPNALETNCPQVGEGSRRGKLPIS